MNGGDKIDTIRQEVDNLLHNKKKLGVSGIEEDRAHFLDLKKQRELLYGAKLKLDGTIKKSPNRTSPNIKFFEGFQTQTFEEHIRPKTTFELDVKELKDEISEREKDLRFGRRAETSYLDMSPKKFRPSDLSLQMKQLDLELERSIRSNMANKLN